MGAGRKTQTLNVSGIIQQPITPNSGCGRNLVKCQLGGIIFGCRNTTMKECRSKQLFGLPARHFSYVKNISPGLPLFLFNYSDRKLHGIFEATSKGEMYIDRYAWTTDSSERTSYPAQVRIRVRLLCHPLPEDKFGPVIADNYYTNNHFHFELDHGQTSKLVYLLTSLAIAPGTPVPRFNTKWIAESSSLPSQETLEKGESSRPSRRTCSAKVTSLDGDIEPLETQYPAVMREVKEDEKKNLKYKNNMPDHENDDSIDDENNMCYVESNYLEISTGLEKNEECCNLPFVDQYTIPEAIEVIQDVEELTAFKKIQNIGDEDIVDKISEAT